MEPRRVSQLPDERTARRKLYKSPRWRGVRARQLQREPHCRTCSLRGIKTPASHVDHIEPVPDPVMTHLREFWSGPLQSLCVSCHSSKTTSERQGAPHLRGADEHGNPIDPEAHCYVDSEKPPASPGPRRQSVSVGR
jgi:5-methylcytosine-specific restriction enzyme A